MKSTKIILAAFLAGISFLSNNARGQCSYNPEDCNICPNVSAPAVPPLICPGGPSSGLPPVITMPPGMTLKEWFWSPAATVSPSSGTSAPGMTTFSPVSTTTYTISAVGMGPNILTDGDFSSWSGWGCFAFAYTYYSGSAMPGDHYAVDTDPSLVNSMFYSMGDHTGGTSPNMLIVNSGPLYSGPPTFGNPCWAEAEIPVCKGKDYAFTAWYANLEAAPTPALAPQIQVIVKDAYTGTALYTSTVYFTLGAGGTWNPIDFTFNTGSTTLVNIYIHQVNTNYTPVDFALDDIALNRVCTATATVTLNVDEITGPAAVCERSTITLSAGSSGGVWASADPLIATVDPSGVVAGVAAGVTTISYYSPIGCLLTYVLTVNPAPAPLMGDDFVCSGDMIVMTSATPGGIWSSSPWWMASLTTSSSIGHFHAWGVGVVTISYTAGGCTSTRDVTINMTPPTLPPAYICMGSGTLFTNIPAGGTWTCTPPAVGTITPGGSFTAVGTGTAIVSYTTAEGCLNTSPIEVIDCGAGGYGHAILPFGALCQGKSFMPSLAIGIPTGGTWAVVSGSSVTIDPVTGLVTGVGPGTSTISYTVGGITYYADVTVTGALTPCVVSTLASISGFTFTGVPYGSSIHFEIYPYGAYWPCASPTITVTSTTGSLFLSIADLYTMFGCSATIKVCLKWVSYSGCVWYSNCCAYLNPGPKPAPENTIAEQNGMQLSIIPNPNNGTFTLSGTLPDKANEGQIEVTDILGKVVYQGSIAATEGIVDEHISLPGNLPNGMYIARVKARDAVSVMKFELNR